MKQICQIVAEPWSRHDMRDRWLQWNWLHYCKWSQLWCNPASDSSWCLLFVVVERAINHSHPVGLEGSIILTRKLTRLLDKELFNTGVGEMSSAMNWHTGFGAWITVSASCISAPTIIGKWLFIPWQCFSIIQEFFLQHFLKAACSCSLEKCFLCSLWKNSLIRSMKSLVWLYVVYLEM